MLCSRPGNILVNTSLVVRCFQLNDDNRICLEPFEACPGGGENAFAVAPRIEVLRETHGLEVCRPIAFSITRRQDSDLAWLQAAFVGHAPFADLLSGLPKGVADVRHPDEFGSVADGGTVTYLVYLVYQPGAVLGDTDGVPTVYRQLKCRPELFRLLLRGARRPPRFRPRAAARRLASAARS